MAFLFKSKKHNTLPGGHAGANAGAGAGTDSPSHPTQAVNQAGGRARRPSQTSTPSSSVNNSLNSLGGIPESPDHNNMKGPIPRNREETPSRNGPSFSGKPPLTSAINPSNMAMLPPGQPNSASPALYPWSRRQLALSGPQSPFPRYGAAINSVTKEGDIYIMGGLINSSKVKGDLWVVEAGGGKMACYPIQTSADGPGPRVGHASLLVGNAFIVFGGDTKTDDSDVLDDTLYLLNTSSRHWSRANPSGPKPSGRYGHTLNLLGSKIYVFGGQVEGFFFNDLVAFDLNALQTSTSRWELLLQNSSDGGPAAAIGMPQARTNHSIITYDEKLFLFGGTDGQQWFNDVWVYDPRLNSWSEMDAIGYIPAPREGHSATVVGDTMYVFGGRTEEGHDLGDLAAFRIPTRRWYTFQNMGPAPSARSGHSMTAYGKQIIVMAGEPSTAGRDANELSLIYLLDTQKIRYPPESHATPNASGMPSTRRPSGSKDSMAMNSGLHRDGSRGAPDAAARMQQSSRESVTVGPGPGPGSGSGPGPGPVAPMNGGPVGSRLPRASLATTPGPPPSHQVPTSQSNGNGPRSKTPTKPDRVYGPPVDTRTAALQREVRSPRSTPSPVAMNDVSSPHVAGRRTPSQQASKLGANAAKAMEAGEAAPLVTSGSLRSRSRHGRSRSSMSSVGGEHAGSSGEANGEVTAQNAEETVKSPRRISQNLALMKELEALRTKNEWYASELALARKAGYQPNFSNHSPIDERNGVLSDRDRPMMEALLSMKAEIANMQASVDDKATNAAQKMAEIERQRDNAVAEAVYARARLAAQGNSIPGTPEYDLSAKEVCDLQTERLHDTSHRLALALAAQSDLKTKIEAMSRILESEKRARQLAEETAEAAMKQVANPDQQRSMELESLRAELHQAEKEAREASARYNEIETKFKLVGAEHDDLTKKLQDALANSQERVAVLASLREALQASTDKADTLERELEDERTSHEELEQKVHRLQAESEERTAELERVTRRLKETEELSELNAKEAETHRLAVLSGLDKATSDREDSPMNSTSDLRVNVLQQQIDQANALVRTNQSAADAASEKLRRAEERIAGLEVYQEQASREGLRIRRELQAAVKESQTLSTENLELKRQLESQQRDASALAVQHGALKDLLGERGISTADTRPSRSLDSPGSRYGTPEQYRLRELEVQLEQSMKAHEDTRSMFESREQEADRVYREKLEQLEQDYQSAVHYVKGTEKMLKRMKDELNRYKKENARLESELTEALNGRLDKHGADNEAGDWQSERCALQKELHDMQEQLKMSVSQLESQLQDLRSELHAVEDLRDKYRMESEDANKELVKMTEQSRVEVSQLKHENTLLESRALDAEQRVSQLLEQVELSVDTYRRQSQQIQAGAGGGRQRSESGESATLGRSGSESLTRKQQQQQPEGYDVQGSRNSMALDNFASELDALRSQWETSHRAYRLSSQFDFEKSPTSAVPAAGDMNDSLTNWRQKLDDLEETDSIQNNDEDEAAKHPAGDDEGNGVIGLLDKAMHVK